MKNKKEKTMNKMPIKVIPTTIFLKKNKITSLPKVNQEIKVIKLSDETGEESFLGKSGTVIYFNYDCGCGQSYPNDPMIGIKFKDEVVEEFWKEEISY